MLPDFISRRRLSRLGGINQRRLFVPGLAIMGVLYLATLVLIVDSAMSYKQEETMELMSAKAEAVASLVASNTEISDEQYNYLLDLRYDELLSDPINRNFEREIRAAIGDSTVKYVYLISQLSSDRISYNINAEEAAKYGMETGAPMNYIYLLDAVNSSQQRIDDTNGKSYRDIDRYTVMDEKFDKLYHRRQREHMVISDRRGGFISGFAPFYTKDGSYVGMIGVDISMEDYQSAMMRFHMVIGSFVMVNLVIVAITVWLISFAVKSLRVNNKQRMLLNHDALTMTLSRRGIMQALAEFCEIVEEGKLDKTAYFFIIDVDNFKEYNDHYGHVMGDRALERIGLALRQAAEEFGGVTGRYGGDEFMMILTDPAQSDINDIADKILAEVRALEIEHISSPVSVYKSVSIGMATVKPDQHITPEKLIEQADKALYRAKRNGRNQASA